MAIQLLLPFQADPDGNFPNVDRHATKSAKHLDADGPGLVLNADHPLIGNPLANCLTVGTCNPQIAFEALTAARSW